jgi:hypothetical protein
MGTSQAIGPYRTVYTPTSQSTSFSVFVDSQDFKKKNNFQDICIPPEIPRTDPRDNTGNRYSITTFANKNIFCGVFLDDMRIVTSEVKKYMKFR